MNVRFIKQLYSTPLLTTVYRKRALFTPYVDGRSEVTLTADLLAEKDKDGNLIWRNAVNMIARIRRELQKPAHRRPRGLHGPGAYRALGRGQFRQPVPLRGGVRA